MSEVSQEDWTPYSVGKRSTRKNWVNADCQRLSIVSHVTHVGQALEVLRAGCIRPQLIYDKSRLNTKRVLVVWLSPNDWSGAGGFRYGNVAFDLDWATLVENKRLYWIGAMPYKPKACRILLTEKDRDEKLKPYLPGNGDGPWWGDQDQEKHYWNGHYCLEFMLEDEIPISAVSQMRFVGHHSHRCSISTVNCPDRGHDGGHGAARLLAGACDRHLLSQCPELWLDDDKPKQCLTYAWERLHDRLCKGIKEWDGLVAAGTERATAVARAGMGALCDLSVSDRKNLFALFNSPEAVVEACASVIEKDFDLKAGTLQRQFDD